MAQIKARTVQTCVVFLPVPPLILMGFHQRGQNGRIFPPADRAAPAPTRHNWHHTSGTAYHRIWIFNNFCSCVGFASFCQNHIGKIAHGSGSESLLRSEPTVAH